MTYERLAPTWHRFRYGTPLGRDAWYKRRLEDVAAIEAAATELTAFAFEEARRAEQELMRRVTPLGDGKIRASRR